MESKCNDINNKLREQTYETEVNQFVQQSLSVKYLVGNCTKIKSINENVQELLNTY